MHLENCTMGESIFKGQARKGARRMPRRWMPKKDGASTEMPRGAASGRRSGDIRMGEPILSERAGYPQLNT